MTVRLSGEDIEQAITECVTNRNMQIKGKIDVRVHLRNQGWIVGHLEAIVIDVPIGTPVSKQGPYR